MPYANPDALWSTARLAERLDSADVRVLDGSFHLPGSGRDPRLEYRRRHIPGARFFDIDAVCDAAVDLPHMLPSAEDFAAHVGALGIGNDDTVVVYDAPGSAAAARVWWTFQVFGHRRIAVLDGGLEAWLAEHRPISDEPVVPSAASYRATYEGRLVRSLRDMLANLRSRREQMVDNRGAGRFRGQEPEPRPGLRPGHIPGSVNIPFNEFLDPARCNAWRPADDLADAFRRAGIDLARPVAASCGSGVTACATAFAAYLLGHDDVAVYDGSWAEWGSRDDTPVEI